MRRYSGSYAGDPRWIEARFKSTCSCGATIEAGDQAYYFPRSKKAECETCGRRSAALMDDERASTYEV